MKHILIIVILLFMGSNRSLAQVYKANEFDLQVASDKLTVVRANGTSLTIHIPTNRKFKENEDWRSLIENFQNDFRKVRASVPDYKFFNVHYVQDVSLKVNEMVGQEFYMVEEEQGTTIKKNNSCELLAKNIKISFEVENLEELLDPGITNDIDLAIGSMKEKAFSRLVKNNSYYNVSEREFFKPESTGKTSFVLTPGIVAGGFKSSLATEIRLGLGISRNRNLILMTLASLRSWDKTIDQSRSALLLGLTYFPHKSAGIETMFTISDRDNLMGDLNVRTSLKIKHKSLVASIDLYDYPFIEHVGFSVGYGF